MRKTPDSVSKKRQEIGRKLQTLKEKLQEPGLTPSQLAFGEAEIRLLGREFCRLGGKRGIWGFTKPGPWKG